MAGAVGAPSRGGQLGVEGGELATAVKVAGQGGQGDQALRRHQHPLTTTAPPDFFLVHGRRRAGQHAKVTGGGGAHEVGVGMVALPEIGDKEFDAVVAHLFLVIAPFAPEEAFKVAAPTDRVHALFHHFKAGGDRVGDQHIPQLLAALELERHLHQIAEVIGAIGTRRPFDQLIAAAQRQPLIDRTNRRKAIVVKLLVEDNRVIE